jgi:hypothetical protein
LKALLGRHFACSCWSLVPDTAFVRDWTPFIVAEPLPDRPHATIIRESAQPVKRYTWVSSRITLATERQTCIGQERSCRGTARHRREGGQDLAAYQDSYSEHVPRPK